MGAATLKCFVFFFGLMSPLLSRFTSTEVCHSDSVQMDKATCSKPLQGAIHSLNLFCHSDVFYCFFIRSDSTIFERVF